MRRPFDGIQLGKRRSFSTGRSRRSVLRSLAAASVWLVSPVACVHLPSADPPQPGDTAPEAMLEEKRVEGNPYGSYFVVPADPRGFDEARRKELGISAKYQDGWPSRPELRRTRGYLTWMTADQAAGLRADPGISAVHEFAPSDTIISGRPSEGPTEIVVSLYPNGLREEPKEDTFLTTKDLGVAWSKEFGQYENVQVFTGMKGNKLYIWVESGEIPPALITALKENPQAYHVNFTGRATRSRLGLKPAGVAEVDTDR